jgi:hypothetical protein
MPEMGRLQLSAAIADQITFDQENQDVVLSRLAANILGLAVDDYFGVDGLYLDRTNRDQLLSRLSATHSQLSGGLKLGNTLNMNSKKIISLAAPTSDNDGARKVYVDDSIDTDIATHAADIDAHIAIHGQILRTGEYITPNFLRSSTANNVIVADRLRAQLFVVPRDITIDRLAVHCVTLEANADARLGIYSNGTNMYPGALLLDAGAVDLDTTGVKPVTIDPALSVPKGVYWLAIATNSPGNVGKLYELLDASLCLAVEATDFSVHYNSWEVVFTYAALPDPFTAGGSLTSARGSVVFPRIASLT